MYPFVRSYEWYLLPDAERRALLAEHGQMAREYPDVRANTVSSFALGDYEWILAFEADELHRIVDLMRHLRGFGDAAARARGSAVLHRAPAQRGRARRLPAVPHFRFTHPVERRRAAVHSRSGHVAAHEVWPTIGARRIRCPQSVTASADAPNLMLRR